MPPRAPTDPYVRISRIRLVPPRPHMRYATRGRLVDSGVESNASALLPGHGTAARRPLPSTGSSRHKFPGFPGTMERSDSRPSVPTRFVSFAGRLPLRAPVFAPAKPDAGLGPGVLGQAAPRACRYRSGDGRASQVPGESSCAYALFSDPGRTATHQAVTVRQHGPRTHHDEGSSREVISGLNGTASALPVYASPAGLLAEDARLGSGCWPSSTRRDSDPQDSSERFP